MQFPKSAGTLVLIAAVASGLQGCGQPTSPQTDREHAQDHSHEEHGGTPHQHAEGEIPHTNGAESADGGFVTVRDHRFKLVPDIGHDNVTHLDMYVQNVQSKSVAGSKIVIHLTDPSGGKQTFNLAEGEGYYHVKTTLSRPGEYQAVAQVTINGAKYNPRFAFERP